MPLPEISIPAPLPSIAPIAPLVTDPSKLALEPSPVPAPTNQSTQGPFYEPPIPVTLSPLSQLSDSDEPSTTHRYPTRFAISQADYSMSCTPKYVYAANVLSSQPTPSVHFSEHYASPVIDPVSGKSLEYRHLMQGPDCAIWKRALANDIGRLAQGVGTRMPTGNNTIFFVHPSEIPLHKKVTYGRLVVDIRPLKEEKFRVRVTVGGDKLDFVGDASSVAASLSTVKLLLNSVISTKDAEFLTADIKDFFYGSVLPDPEFMKLPLKIIPQEIIDQYNLMDIQVDNYVYIKIVKGMPGLKQAARLANDRLIAHLQPYGYAPVPHTPSLWKHTSNGIVFTLVVDDFGIKTTSPSATAHLLQALRDKYVITTDPSGSKYLGFTLQWDYVLRKVWLSMPKYVSNALHRLQHKMPKRPQHAPHPYAKPAYGQKVQFAIPQDDNETLLPESAKKTIQQIIGIFCTMV